MASPLSMPTPITDEQSTVWHYIPKFACIHVHEA